MKRLMLTVIATLLILPALHAERRLVNADELSAFFSSTTMVVTTNDNIIVDALLRDAVKRLWNVTPYKMADNDEFKAARTNASASFLIVTKVVESNDPLKRPYLYLNVLMGNKDAAEDLDKMPELATIPLASIWNEHVWLPMLDASVLFVQKHVQNMKDKNFCGRLLTAFQQRLQAYNDEAGKLKGKDVYVCTDDVDSKVDMQALGAKCAKLHFVDKAQIDEVVKSANPNVVVAYAVYPQGKQRGAYGYKLVLGLDGTLYYYYYERKAKKFLLQSDDIGMLIRHLQ